MVTIPKDIKDKVKLKVGDEVEVKYLTDQQTVTIKPKKKALEKREISNIIGHLNIPNFNPQQSYKDIKKGAYERLNLP